MAEFHKKLFLFGVFIVLSFQSVFAQDLNFQQDLNQGLIRIADTGQLADTLNLWGDVKNSGKYLVPRGTNLTDLISYARGPAGISQGQTWSKVNLEVFISRYNQASTQYQNKEFKLKLDQPLPKEMRNYPLQNGDVITVKAKRKPSFRDYFTIIAPVLSLGLTIFIAADRLNHH